MKEVLLIVSLGINVLLSWLYFETYYKGKDETYWKLYYKKQIDRLVAANKSLSDSINASHSK